MQTNQQGVRASTRHTFKTFTICFQLAGVSAAWNLGEECESSAVSNSQWACACVCVLLLTFAGPSLAGADRRQGLNSSSLLPKKEREKWMVELERELRRRDVKAAAGSVRPSEKRGVVGSGWTWVSCSEWTWMEMRRRRLHGGRREQLREGVKKQAAMREN